MNAAAPQAEAGLLLTGGDKYLPDSALEVPGEQGDTLAKVIKTLYMHKKPEPGGLADRSPLMAVPA